MTAQYGEDEVIQSYFAGRSHGFIVDVGAHDGEENSNSYGLLCKGWNGVLIEPNPVTFPDLQARWGFRYPNVKLFNLAASMESGNMDFFVWGQSSTLDPAWRDRCIELYQAQYHTVKVAVRPLREILAEAQVPANIHLLSVDCEGKDCEVLESMDWKRYRVEMVIVEDSGADRIMLPLGFRRHAQTLGNLIYVR